MPRSSRRPTYYRLIGKLPVPCTMEEWGRASEASGGPTSIVFQEQIGPMFVSTVFLGLDHNWSPDPNAPAILFETMIFDADEDDGYQRRYATWDEAEKGHAEAVEHARQLLAKAEASLKVKNEQ